MKNEFAKLKGNDAKFDIVEVSWNNKTGKGIAKKLIASKVDWELAMLILVKIWNDSEKCLDIFTQIIELQFNSNILF